MIKFNSSFDNLKKDYLFVDMRRKISEYQKQNPEAKIIKLGVGDVTLPIAPVIIEAMHAAVDEMANAATFKGYGPHEGYEFLREAIANSYKKRGVAVSKDEIYISDGSKNDAANIQDIFSTEGNVLIPNPTYPAYVDASLMAGRNICYVSATQENNFLPLPDSNVEASLIYLCSPNNPTGATYNKEQLKKWVDYAIENQAIILFDTAYRSFIENKDLPHSIYEVEGAEKCAIELCSFSKSAGFTGLRCAYIVIPSELKIDGVKVGDVWLRRLAAKFNGVSYITQKAALAALSEKGQEQISESIQYYKKNAQILSSAMKNLGIWHIGGENSPYIWLKCPNGMHSWEFFDYLLEKFNVVGTPGAGFGPNGEGFFRFSAFGNHEETLEAVERLKELKVKI